MAPLVPNPSAKVQTRLVQARVHPDLDHQVGELAERHGMSRSDFLRTALEHEAQRLTQTRPARPVSLQDLQRQQAAMATELESIRANQTRSDLLLEQIALALGVNLGA